MFGILGNLVSRSWHLVLAGWLVVLAGLWTAAPPWDEVVRDGEFRFMPDDAPSRLGEQVFEQAFSGGFLGSNVVVVLRRISSENGLLEKDRAFIEEVLKPRIERIAHEEGGLASEPPPDGGVPSVIAKVRTFSDRSLGHLLESQDRKASLVIVEMTSEFAASANWPTVEKIERLISSGGELRAERTVPPGLDMTISGSAIVGRDMNRAARHTAAVTERVTVAVTALLLLAVFRAPFLAMVPLATLFVSVRMTLAALALAAEQGVIGLFMGLETYLTVVLYGAGIGSCLFLIARYREEVDAGATLDEATAHAVTRAAMPSALSAATIAVGLGTMLFAGFGKFQQAGIALPMGVLLVWLAALTLTPALLRLVGRWVFWPQVRTERISAARGWVSPSSLVPQLLERNWSRLAWDRISRMLVHRPGTVWLGGVSVLLPLAVTGVLFFHHLSYGMLAELPPHDPSVVGARAVQEHFPAGITGPVTLLLDNRHVNFSENEGAAAISELTQRLEARRDELELADVRSITHPLGVTPAARKAEEQEQQQLLQLRFRDQVSQRVGRRKRILEHYVSSRGGLEDHVTRLDFVFRDNPFSRDTIARFEQLQQTVAETLPDELRTGSRLLYIGPTASIRDLKAVTAGDQARVSLLISAALWLVLAIVLRRPVLSACLVAHVVFAFLVTLGATFVLFWSLDPDGFAGLDWKVPMFLFAVLGVLGAEFPLQWILRCDEERRRHGPVHGVTVALTRTGNLLSNRGLLMAGAFSSLMAGSLAGMSQLGFALSFGVLLHAFVLRPLLLPAWLILVQGGRLGTLGRLSGPADALPGPVSPSASAPTGTLEVPSGPVNSRWRAR